MTPFKKQQHKYVLYLGVPIIIFMLVMFYSRLMAYYSEPLYLEGEVTHCEYKNFTDSRPIYLAINENRYDFSRPGSAFSAVKNICEKHGEVGIYYHVITTPITSTEEREIREMLEIKTGKLIFSRTHYYEYERSQVFSFYLLLIVFIPAVIYSSFVTLGRVDDDSVSTFKEQYKQNKNVIRVRSGEGLIEGIFMIVIGFGAFIYSLNKIYAEGFSWVYLFMMPLVVAGYVYLVGIVNYRYVRIANGLLQVKKGPLPQLNSQIDININKIEEIYCDYEISRSRHGSSEVISVVAALKEDSVDDEGEDIILFFTKTHEEARAITDTLNDMLKNY